MVLGVVASINGGTLCLLCVFLLVFVACLSYAQWQQCKFELQSLLEVVLTVLSTIVVGVIHHFHIRLLFFRFWILISLVGFVRDGDDETEAAARAARLEEVRLKNDWKKAIEARVEALVAQAARLTLEESHVCRRGPSGSV